VIIDANVHATCDGRWFDTGVTASLERLLATMTASGVDRAVLTGLPRATSTADVLTICRAAGGRLIPVGTFNPTEYGSAAEVRRAARVQLAGHGLTGVKLHPRLDRYDLLDDRVIALLDEIASWEEENLGVWVCTLLHVPGMRVRHGPVETLCEIVGRHPELTFVLLHGGGPDLLALATAVRPARNALLDISWTVTSLAQSSVMLDLRHLLATFGERLVFGSDFPEQDMGAARAQVESLADPATAALVLGENLVRMFGDDLAAR
jgi:predicted TIM-barrel fold metal-dependent hydrolase